MPRQITNSFTEYELTSEELYLATRFTDLQIMLIQSLLSKTSQLKLRVRIDTTALQESLQQEASLAGQIDAYEHLLALYTDTSNPAVKIP